MTVTKFSNLHSKLSVELRSTRNIRILINHGVNTEYVNKRTYTCSVPTTYCGYWVRSQTVMAEGRTTRSDVDTEHSEHEMEAITLQPKRRRCLLLCGHCDRYLSKSTYYRHRDAYFNHASGQWQISHSDDVSCLSGDSSSGTEQGDNIYREGQGEGQWKFGGVLLILRVCPTIS